MQAIIDNQNLTREEKLAAGRAIKEAAADEITMATEQELAEQEHSIAMAQGRDWTADSMDAMANEAAAVAGTKASEITKIRRAVATLANRINKKYKNLSASFKKAWALVKGKAVSSKVSGVTYGKTQTALQHLIRYDTRDITAELIREPGNEYDDNAVGVHVSVKGSKTYQIGFLPKDIAKYISNLIDSGITLTATFTGVTGGTERYHNYGALIEVSI